MGEEVLDLFEHTLFRRLVIGRKQVHQILEESFLLPGQFRGGRHAKVNDQIAAASAVDEGNAFVAQSQTCARLGAGRAL